MLLLGAEASTDELAGVEFPRVIEWTCHRVLVHAGDNRAGEWLARAYEALQAQAAVIRDAEVRRGFLSNIPVHREIEAAWAAREAATYRPRDGPPACRCPEDPSKDE